MLFMKYQVIGLFMLMWIFFNHPLIGVVVKDCSVQNNQNIVIETEVESLGNSKSTSQKLKTKVKKSFEKLKIWISKSKISLFKKKMESDINYLAFMSFTIGMISFVIATGFLIHYSSLPNALKTFLYGKRGIQIAFLYISFVLSLTGMIMGIISIIGDKSGKGMGITGLVLSFISFILSLILIAIIYSA